MQKNLLKKRKERKQWKFSGKKICAKHISYIYNCVVQFEAPCHAKWHHPVSFLSVFTVEFLVQHTCSMNYTPHDCKQLNVLHFFKQCNNTFPNGSIKYRTVQWNIPCNPSPSSSHLHYSTYAYVQAQAALGCGPHSKLEETQPCSGLGFKVLIIFRLALQQLLWKLLPEKVYSLSLLHYNF
jgi:hypothetical protein